MELKYPVFSYYITYKISYRTKILLYKIFKKIINRVFWGSILCLKNNLIKEGFTKVRNFTWDNCANNTKEVYKKIT